MAVRFPVDFSVNTMAHIYRSYLTNSRVSHDVSNQLVHGYLSSQVKEF